MRIYALARTTSGPPIVDTEIKGFSLGAEAMSGATRFGLYILMGTREQMIAVDDDPDAVAMCQFWQLDNTVSAGKRTEIDAWADANFPSLPSVPIDWTYRQIVDELYSRANEHYTSAGLFLKAGGLAPYHTGIRCLAVSPDPATLNLAYHGEAWPLIAIGDYWLYELCSDEDELMRVHNALYDLAPGATFGLLAVVDVYGTSFYPYAVMSTFDHPASELIARRNRIASYLESLDYSSTAELRAAVTEHAEVSGIVTALGYTMPVLWNVMHG